MDIIYQKESNLDKQNNSAIEISKKSYVEKENIHWWKPISYLNPGPEN